MSKFVVVVFLLTLLNDFYSLSHLKIIDLSNAQHVEALTEEREDFLSTLTDECNNLLHRIKNCSPSLTGLRRIMKDYREFADRHLFDPFVHNDYEFVHTSVSHL